MSPEAVLHRACDRCRQKKAKCDSIDYSCSGCRGAGHGCTFDIAPGKRGPKGKPRRRNTASPSYSPASHFSSPHRLTVVDRWNLLAAAVSTATSFSKSLEDVLRRCTDLFFNYIAPFNMSVHEPTFRRSLSQALNTSPPATTLTQTQFTLLTAVSAKVCFFMPAQLLPSSDTLASTLLSASRSSLASYADSDLDNPSADSITIRYLHSNCLHTNAKPMVAWHVFGEALRLVQRMRLHDEASYPLLDPVEAQMRRNAFWQIYVGDKSLAVLRSMPITVYDYAFEGGTTVEYPSSDENELTLGTNAGVRLWQYATDLIMRTRLIRKDRPGDVSLTSTDHTTLSELYVRFATCLDDLPPYLRPDRTARPSNTKFIVQVADLHVTYHCLKMHLVRQLEDVGYFSRPGERDELLVLRKTDVAADMVCLLQSVPFWSLQVNGEPCAEKIRLVGANLLALTQKLSSSSPLAARARRDFDVLLDILSQLDSKASDTLRQEIP